MNITRKKTTILSDNDFSYHDEYTHKIKTAVVIKYY